MRMVVKIGGALDGTAQKQLSTFILNAKLKGYELFVVHGGGKEISRRLEAAGLTLSFKDGLRMTSKEAIPVVVEALTFCNHQIVNDLRQQGVFVEPIVDGDLVRAKDMGYERTGSVDTVIVNPLLKMTQGGHIPLLPPFGKSEFGEFYNMNADAVAAAVAVACSADKLVFCTDVNGVFSDFKQGVQLYDISQGTLNEKLEAGVLSEGMIPKVEAMLQASAGGVCEVWVVNGKDEASLSYTLNENVEFSDTRCSYGTRLLTCSELGVQL